MPKKNTAAKTKTIRVTIEVEFEAVDGNMFDSAGNAEQAIGNYLHEWLSDGVEIGSFDCDAEEVES